MTPNDIGAPPAPDDIQGPPTGGAEPQGDVSEAHYRGPDSRCYNCEFFQDPSTCTKGVNGGTVEPEGGCDLFQMMDEDNQGGGPDTDNDGDMPGAPPSPGPRPPGMPTS